jgi:shikimate dehydrogenase
VPSKKKYLFGLIGHPVKHSLSPLLHEAAFSFHNLDGEYRLLDIQPEQLTLKFDELKRSGFDGVNVTIPHKQAVIPLLDQVVEDAWSIGAVNTIVFSDGKTVGHNTDVYGFSRALEDAIARENIDTNWSRSVLVIGCGGAAKAVVAGLCEMGFLDISIFGRDSKKASKFVLELASSLGPRGRLLIDGAMLRSVECLNEESLSAKFLLVNATPAGQNGEPLPDWFSEALAQLDKRTLVYDLVYSKTEYPTVLEGRARALCLPSVDGLDMLIYQAARAFEIWTGLAVPSDCMKAGLSRMRSK